MPNITAHLGIAHEVATQLKHPVVDRLLGTFLLGSTAPDIRIITRGQRNDTHFAPLSAEDLRAGVQGLFADHPELSDARRLEPATRAFLAGYCTHLIADIAWIVFMYRPFFGNQEVFDDGAEGHVLDRALQLELDRQTREALDDLDGVRRYLAGAEDGVAVGFIAPETLAEWRSWVVEHLGWGFSWERLRRMARRVYPQNEEEATRVVEGFLEHVPSGLESIYERVPRRRMQEFHERTRREVLGCLRGYLGPAEAGE